uniref:glycosyltransferase family 2 protein n=1 Tax=Prevotella sp. TaxID=59823 RepID=UPI003FEE8C8B
MTISLITATYNSGKTVEDTLRSVLAQTYKEIDYWVVDGGSKDDTMDIVRKYEPLFGGRLHWISEPDRGIYDAMNKGISHSTGDVVGILNSDDHFTSNDVLERVAAEMQADNTLDAVYGDIHFIKDGAPDRIVRYYSSKPFRPFWLRFGFMPAHPSFYARREVFEKHGLYSLDYKIAADYDMMVRLFLKHRIKAKYMPMDFVTMLMGGLSTKGVRSRVVLVSEDVKACLTYGFYTNRFMISLKFLYKIFESRFR